ncbi:MAG: glycosyltransferase family 2 protein, partial [Bacteroidia bacterium]|nr:glycosyltransferase family 2 protein [Bacteroidia bacterium]
IFPSHYLETISALFKENSKIGISGGLPYIQKGDRWVFENIASKDHVRGPIKAYRKACFNAIGGLRRSAGWDSVDVLLAKYYGWKVVTDKDLHVKHLKPTGSNYHLGSKYLRGEALYKMRMGFVLTSIASLKSAIKKHSFGYFMNSMRGFFKAKQKKSNFLVDESQGQFIRKHHWQNIYKKLKMS